VAPQVGDIIEDCAWARADGSTVRLSDFAGRPLAVIFLRHLA
jgi:hypothetical protein